jgi:hypothetical protein
MINRKEKKNPTNASPEEDSKGNKRENTVCAARNMNSAVRKASRFPTSSCAFLRAPSSQWYHAHQVDAVMRLNVVP